MKSIMNVYNVIKIARLARQDDKTLVILVTRWVHGKNRIKWINPIPDILLKSQEIALWFTGFLLMVGLLLTFVWGYHQYHTMLAESWSIWSIGMVFVLILALALVGRAMVRTKMGICDNRNADEFCRSIAVIDRLRKEEGFIDDVWERGAFLDVASVVVTNYLFSQAARLQELEGIPWRKKEEEIFNKQFTQELESLATIALLPSNRGLYFKTQLPVTLEEMAKMSSYKIDH
jgi:hypothetical protein